jgi:hypothetical protein
MKNRNRVSYLLAGLMFFVGFSCEQEEISIKKHGSTTFSFTSAASGNGRVATTGTPSFIYLSIQKEDGTEALTNSKLQLLSFGSSFVTSSLEFETGAYKLVSFLVLDEGEKIIYAAPLAGSAKAELVDEALPLSFSITENASTEVRPQVLAVDPTDSPGAFGYTSFSFEVVNPQSMNVRVKVELKVGDITYLDVKTTIIVKGYDEQDNLKWTDALPYHSYQYNDLAVKAGYHHYSFEVQHFGVYVKQILNGDYLLEGSRQSVPPTFVLSGTAEPKKLSHYINYRETTSGATYFVPVTKVQYEYNNLGKVDRMTISNFAESTHSFTEQRYFKFAYANGRVSKITAYETSGNATYLEDTYEYSADGNVSAITEVNTAAGVNAHMNLTYEYTNRLVRAVYAFSNGRGFEYEMVLPNGNMISDKTTSGSELCSTGAYTYDTNINPFKHLGYVDFLLRNYSLYNKITEDVQYIGCAFPSLIPEQYVYEYDTTGYPTSYMTFYQGGTYKSKTDLFYK